MGARIRGLLGSAYQQSQCHVGWSLRILRMPLGFGLSGSVRIFGHDAHEYFDLTGWKVCGGVSRRSIGDVGYRLLCCFSRGRTRSDLSGLRSFSGQLLFSLQARSPACLRKTPSSSITTRHRSFSERLVGKRHDERRAQEVHARTLREGSIIQAFSANARTRTDEGIASLCQSSTGRGNREMDYLRAKLAIAA